MSSTGSFRKKGMAVGFIPIIVIALVFGTYVGTALSSSSGSVSTPPITSTIQGLELNVSISSTTLQLGQSLNISVALFNGLSTLNNISTTFSSWRLVGFPIAFWPQCFYQQPVEFMIVRGNYSLGQLQALSGNTSVPLTFCISQVLEVKYLTFQPKSDVANLTGDFCLIGCSPDDFGLYRMTSNFTVNGYWAYPLNSSELLDLLTPEAGCSTNGSGFCLTFNYPEVGPTAQSLFSVGQYTLVVVAEWGQTVLLHFAVAS